MKYKYYLFSESQSLCYVTQILGKSSFQSTCIISVFSIILCYNHISKYLNKANSSLMQRLPEKETHYLPHKSMILQRQNKLFFKVLFSKFAQNSIFNGILSRVVCMIFIALYLLLYRYIIIKGSISSEMAYADITISIKSSQHLP